MTCSQHVIGTQNIVLTDNVAKTPCCLPGTFKDHSKPHGPCLPGYPCACSPSICYPDAPAGVNNISFDETGAPFPSIGACDSSTASVVKIERIVNENQIRNDVHVDVNDLVLKDSAFKYQLLKDEQSKIITKLDKLSKKVSGLTLLGISFSISSASPCLTHGQTCAGVRMKAPSSSRREALAN